MAKNSGKDKLSEPAPPKKFPIVAIGASAGGLEAVTELLKNLPPDTGMAYVYIQHLDPNHQSKLSEILGRITAMKVKEAKHLMPIEPNSVYIIPPDKTMRVIDGVLSLEKRIPKPVIHMPVDEFFSSLAEKHPIGIIGILLSGNGNDGTAGLKNIKLSGGLSFAQDDSAKFTSMPRSAITEAVVDKVLSPREIARELARLVPHLKIYAESGVEESNEIISKENIPDILRLLAKATGVDFSHYKTNMVRRRIHRRMLILQLEKFGDYYKYLRLHTQEIHDLYRDMLIHVTQFFRDAPAMEYLKKNIITQLVKQNKKETIRVWIPACATGEEAYSIAILILEAMGNKMTCPVQLFATDLSERAITKARLGLYSKSELQHLSATRLNLFFQKIDGSYRLLKSIRDMCVFAVHNVFSNPPFTRMDMISCCNLMIYLDAELQSKLLSIFHYSLKPNAVLILGKSESASTATKLFSQTDKKYKIFTRKNSASELSVFDIPYREKFAPVQTHKFTASVTRSGVVPNKISVEGQIDALLLKQFVPGSVLINPEFEILHFRGSTALFLEPSQGKANLNLLKMARPELVFELRRMVHKASKSGEPVKKNGLQMNVNNELVTVTLEVLPLRDDDSDKLFLVIFRDYPEDLKKMVQPFNTDMQVLQLQQELNASKEDMRLLLEEKEANMEELQSANEEVLSTNEELQTINEELETSKEEVESSNEELLTINNELLMRNSQLTESNEYGDTVFQTIREMVVILDVDYRIIKANERFYKFFQEEPKNTEGKLLFDIGNRQWNLPKLKVLLSNVLKARKEFSNFEMEHTFPAIGKKKILLNASRVIKKITKIN